MYCTIDRLTHNSAELGEQLVPAWRGAVPQVYVLVAI